MSVLERVEKKPDDEEEVEVIEILPTSLGNLEEEKEEEERRHNAIRNGFILILALIVYTIVNIWSILWIYDLGLIDFYLGGFWYFY